MRGARCALLFAAIAHRGKYYATAFAGYAMMNPALVDFPPVPGDEQMVEAIRALPAGSIPDHSVGGRSIQ